MFPMKGIQQMNVHHRIRRLAAVGTLFGLALVSASCGSDVEETGGAEVTGDSELAGQFDLEGKSVRVGTAQEQPLDIGTSYALEILKGWGLDVQREELTNISGLEAIVADRVDVSARSSDEVIEGRDNGVPIYAFGAPSSAMHYALVGAPGIEEVSDLEDKEIAISGPGGFDTILINALLRDAGLDPEADVTQVPIGGSGERTAAMLAGQADAAMVFVDNWLSLQNQEANVGLVGYVADLLPPLSSRAFAAQRAYLDKNPEIARAIACANLEANEWIHNNKQEFVEFTTGRVTGTTEEAVSAFYDEAMDIGLYPTDPADILEPEAYGNTAELMFDGDLISQQFDGSELVDTSYLEEAAANGCGAGQG